MKKNFLLVLVLINLCGCNVQNKDNSFSEITKISCEEIKNIFAIDRFVSSMNKIDISEKNYEEFYNEINVDYKICEDEEFLLKRHNKDVLTYSIIYETKKEILLYYIEGYFVFDRYISLEQIKFDDKFLLKNLKNCF